MCGGADVISSSPPAATGSHIIVSSVSAFHTLLHPSLSLNSQGKICPNAGKESISWPPFSPASTGTLTLPEEAVPDGLMEGCCLSTVLAALLVFRHQKGLGCMYPLPAEITAFPA